MALSAKISKTGVWLWHAALWVAGAQSAGCAKASSAAGSCDLASVCSAGACAVQQNFQDGGSDPTCQASKPDCFSGDCEACDVDSQCGLPTPSCSDHACVCRMPSSTNKLTNPGFDAGFASWIAQSATLSADAESCAGSNAVFVETTEDSPRQCFTLPAGTYYVGGKFKGPPGTGSFVRTKFWTSADCTGNRVYPDADVSLDDITGEWEQYSVPFDTPAGTVSISVGIYGIQLSVDQMFVGTAAQF